MLRLPPTSISLSEDDIGHHLRQVSIYEGLLRQGFKKRDILRYYTESATKERLATATHDEPTPTSVEMVTSRRMLSLELPVEVDPVPFPVDHVCVSPQSCPSMSELANARHAPRQSSLLRFAKNVSPDTSASEETQNTPVPDFTPSPRTQMRYRHRSQTDPYTQSEADDANLGPTVDPLEDDFSQLSLDASPINTMQSSNIDTSSTGAFCHTTQAPSKNSSSSPLRPQAPTFHPLVLPPPFSATRRVSSSQSSLPSVSRSTTPMNTNYEIHSRSTASLLISTPPRNGSISGLHLAASPASPEPVSSPYQLSPRSSPPVLLPSHLLTTPTRIHNVLPPRTEPRDSRHQNLDGTSFNVYDDRLPASSQPQTPADLSRQPMLTEREAAYTAPPGRIQSQSAASRYRAQAFGNADPGEQSPTVRAIGMRERRNRESWRSARADSQRWARIREEEAARVREFVSDRPEPTIRDMWRDELDVDRVGEENFEGDTGFARTIRIVSGGRLVGAQERRGQRTRENGQG